MSLNIITLFLLRCIPDSLNFCWRNGGGGGNEAPSEGNRVIVLRAIYYYYYYLLSKLRFANKNNSSHSRDVNFQTLDFKS